MFLRSGYYQTTSLGIIKTRPHIRDVYSCEQAIKLLMYTFLPSHQYAPKPIDLLDFNLVSIHVFIYRVFAIFVVTLASET